MQPSSTQVELLPVCVTSFAGSSDGSSTTKQRLHDLAEVAPGQILEVIARVAVHLAPLAAAYHLVGLAASAAVPVSISVNSTPNLRAMW